jgi:hypothetical protein
MEVVVLWMAVGGMVIAFLGAIAWRLRRRVNPNSLEALGLLPRPDKVDPGEVARLRQNLRLKVLYDEAKIDRLVAAERERLPAASEVEWYRAAVERWERDNR